VSTTPEATEETLTRFRLDALREHVRRIWAAMQGDNDRGPQDYPAWDDERKILINIIRRQTERAGGGNYTEGGGDGSNGPWQKTFMTIVGGAALAGIIATVGMYAKLATIQANQDNQGRQIEELKSQVTEMRQSLRTNP
jgi:hypothetical protein